MTAGDTIEYTNEGYFTYYGYQCITMHLAGNIPAYCGDHDALTPATGSYPYSSANSEEKIRCIIAYSLIDMGLTNATSGNKSERYQVARALNMARHGGDDANGRAIYNAAISKYLGKIMTVSETELEIMYNGKPSGELDAEATAEGTITLKKQKKRLK